MNRISEDDIALPKLVAEAMEQIRKTKRVTDYYPASYYNIQGGENMYFYDDGINQWEITYGNSSGDLTVPQREQHNYSSGDVIIIPDTATDFTIPQEEYLKEYLGQWVEEEPDDDSWVEGYRQWYSKNEDFIKLLRETGEPGWWNDPPPPKKGQQLEFDFLRLSHNK